MHLALNPEFLNGVVSSSDLVSWDYVADPRFKAKYKIPGKGSTGLPRSRMAFSSKDPTLHLGLGRNLTQWSGWYGLGELLPSSVAGDVASTWDLLSHLFHKQDFGFTLLDLWQVRV